MQTGHRVDLKLTVILAQILGRFNINPVGVLGFRTLLEGVFTNQAHKETVGKEEDVEKYRQQHTGDDCVDDAENDADGDGICGDVDECPYDADNDADADGICGDVDDCPYDAENDADLDEICGDEPGSITIQIDPGISNPPISYFINGDSIVPPPPTGLSETFFPVTHGLYDSIYVKDNLGCEVYWDQLVEVKDSIRTNLIIDF